MGKKKLGITRDALYARRRKYGNNMDIVLRQGPQPLGAFRVYTGSKAKLIQIGDESKTVKEWAKQIGMSIETVYNRIRKGLTGQGILHRGYITGYGVKITYNGCTLNQTDWAKKLGVSRQRIQQRLKKYPVDEALSIVKHYARQPKLFFTVGSETLSITEWSIRSGVLYGTINQRLNRGIPPELACTMKESITAKVLEHFQQMQSDGLGI